MKKILLALVLFFTIPLGVSAASDSFEGAAAVLADPPWTQQRASPLVRRNGGGALVTTADNDGFVFWNADSFSADQYSQGTIDFIAENTDYAYVTVRASDTGDASLNHYAIFTDGASGNGHTSLYRMVDGSSTALRDYATTFVSGDIIRLEISGTLITAYKNGISIGTHNDGTISSGAPGFGMFGTTGAKYSFWEGGNLVADNTPAFIRMMGSVMRITGSIIKIR